jgi:glutaredoxin
MDKLKVYVRSHELSTLQFVDFEGGKHACAQASKSAYEGLGSVSNLFGNRYLCDEDREALAAVEGYCKDNGLEYEVIDLGRMSSLRKLLLRMKGIKTPTLCYEDKMLCGVPTEESLRRLLAFSER